MRKKIFWRSWSALESQLELSQIQNLPLKNKWESGYTGDGWDVRDVWLTTNGGDYLNGAKVFQASWFAESYYCLQEEYKHYFTDKRFNHRFHFNPNFYKAENCSYLPIYCWWKHEISTFNEIVNNKKPQFTFGMVAGNRLPKEGQPDCYFGWIRAEIVKASKDRDFRYYGHKWPQGDKNYGGEIYINGGRSTPLKFNDARILMGKSKFVWTVENTHDEYYSINYMTEKIFHGFLSASIPIYGGAWNIAEMIDPSLFIDMRKFDYNLNSIMDYCEKMPETEYQGYLSRIGEFLNKEGQKFTGEQRFLDLDNYIYNNF